MDDGLVEVVNHELEDGLDILFRITRIMGKCCILSSSVGSD